MKKLLFLLITIFSFNSSLFADTCDAGTYPVYNWTSTVSLTNYTKTGTYRVGPNLARVAVVGGGYQGRTLYYYTKSVYYNCVALDTPPTSSDYQETANNETCSVINGQLVCIENGNYQNGELSCNNGFSKVGEAIGVRQCLPNPENGTYDDNSDLICNAGYYNNNGTCVLDPSYTGDEVQNVDGYDYDIKDGDYFNKSPVTGLIEAVENSDGYTKARLKNCPATKWRCLSDLLHEIAFCLKLEQSEKKLFQQSPNPSFRSTISQKKKILQHVRKLNQLSNAPKKPDFKTVRILN